MLNDSSRDPNSNGISTSFTAGVGGSFVASPVCYGVSNCFRSNTVNTFSNDEAGGVIGNTNDINSGNDLWRTHFINMWVSCSDVSTPTCAYEQGGGTNNRAINFGLARSITAQAADAGQQFILNQSSFLAQENRKYMVTSGWQHRSQHSGSGNRGILYVNGVVQPVAPSGVDWFESSATATFPSHTGSIVIGNTGDTLKSYNESTQRYVPRAKDCNMFSLHNDRLLTASELRELFERTVIPEHIISGTVSQQQSQLNALSGTEFKDVNCAIQIRQATDSTSYSLELDNIKFVKNDFTQDIAISYIGENTLTIVNKNGSNAEITSTPFELDIDGTSTPLVGGGNIVIEYIYNITFSGLNPNSEVRLFDDSNNEIAGIESSSTSWTTPVKGNFRAVVFHVEYDPIYFDDLFLTDNTTIPVQQIFSRNYKNS